MKQILIILMVMLSSEIAFAGARVNCPWHGVQNVSSTSEKCPVCKKETERKEREERYKIEQNKRREEDRRRHEETEAENKRRREEIEEKRKRIAENKILESEITDCTIINIDSFVNTNFLYKKCFTEITNGYFKTSEGTVFSKRLSLHRMRVVQHIGFCEYIVDVDEWEPHRVSSWNEYDKDDSPSGKWENIGWHKVTLYKTGDNLADNEVGNCYGYPSNEVYEYTTVMGAIKRIKVFKPFSEKDMLPITFDDILNHLKEGRSFMINFKHLAITYGKPWQKTSFNVFIVKNDGKFVVFGK